MARCFEFIVGTWKDRREREKEWARAGKRERSMAGRVKVPLLALQLASE